LAFDINWWWKFQSHIESDFDFSKIRETVSTKLSSRYFTINGPLNNFFQNQAVAIVGAGITDSDKIPNEVIVAADGAVKACLERDVLPDIIVTDMDGYIADIKWAHENGSKIILHVHGDNLTRFADYSPVVHPICVTSAYPSAYTSCWGGFTDGDRALMMVLSLNCKSAKLVGFDFEKIGNYSGEYSSRKLQKLKWAKKIIDECIKRSEKVSFI